MNYKLLYESCGYDISIGLRPLSDMTVGENEDARKMYEEIDKYGNDDMKKVTQGFSKVTLYFLSKGFDLFNLNSI